MKVKPWAWISLGIGAIYFILPLLAVFLFSLRGTKDVLGFSAYMHVLQDDKFIDSFLFSLKIAALVIVLSFALIIPTAIHVRLHFPRLRSVLETIVNLPFTIPVIVLAFGLIRLYSGGFGLQLTQSVFLLVAGSMVICLPYVYRMIDSGLESIKLKTLTEAAKSLGVGSWRTLFVVILPNLRTSLLGAASIIFAMVMGELTLSLMLAWPAFGPYMALMGRDHAYEPAALAVMSFLLTWASIALFHLLGSPQRIKK
ncbi:MAG: ABC transporter permease [Formosimonas sp.]